MLGADNGVVLSWGRGEDGQLGHGDANERRQAALLRLLATAGAALSGELAAQA